MKLNKPDLSFEKEFWKKNKIVAGVDEVGRGCLAGPVCAASVILNQDYKIPTILNDSKKLSEKQRNEVFELLINSNCIYSWKMIDNKRIDQINILNATYEAMNQSIDSLSQKPDHLLVDGNRFKGSDIPFTTIIKGDSKSLSIAAASVIAKVIRDRYMKNELHKILPEYNFKKHKGYATKEHFIAIEKNGISNFHRESFLVKFKTRQLSIFN